MTLRRVDNESGIALAVAVFAMVIMGAMVSGAFLIGMQEQRVGRNSVQAQQAFMAAEGGAGEYVANWDSIVNRLAIGDSATFSGWLTDNVGWYRGSVLRINGSLFLVRSEGFSRDSLARQQVGALVRTESLEMNVVAAIVAPGRLKKVTPLCVNSGFDMCGGPDNVAGLQVPNGGLQYAAGGDPTDVFEGNPAIDEAGTDPLAIAQNLGIDWEQVLNSTAFDYVIVDETEFPDFSTLPADFYPSILVTGPRIDLFGPPGSLDHSGRGILVIPEQMWTHGAWQWDGVVLVGNFFNTNGRMDIDGTIVAGLNILTGTPPASITPSTLGAGLVSGPWAGPPTVEFDSCALQNTLDQFSLGANRLQERYWVDMN